jgi:hypothetical protein
LPKEYALNPAPQLPEEKAAVKGQIVWTLYGPDNQIKDSGVVDNLVTRVGDQMYGERGAGIAGAVAAPTGIKLGTGSTAASKTGAGAALVTYLTDSHQGFDSGYPASSLSGSARRITYQVTYAPNKATSAAPITEVALVNNTLTDATSAEADTVARAILSPSITAKSAGDTLVVVWTHDLQGS